MADTRLVGKSDSGRCRVPGEPRQWKAEVSYEIVQIMTFRTATLDDCPRLAELNHQLIRDEGHRNPMTVPELDQRMRDWISCEYRAIIYEDGGEIVAYALFREQAQKIYLRQLFVLGIVGVRALAVARRAVGYVDYALSLEILPAN